jgi:chorismate synthase
MKYLTAGESHGKAIVGIIDSYPSGVRIDIDFINNELKRRQKGFGRGERMAIEDDRVDIISGIRKEKSTGSPISFLIYNKDWKNWKDKIDKEDNLLNPRPGHADFSGLLKYHLASIRDTIERSSARETAARVCVGSFAKIILKMLGINIFSYVNQIGKVIYKNDVKINLDIVKKTEDSQVRCPDNKKSLEMKQEIIKASENGNSIGGGFKIIATNLVPGIGSYNQGSSRIDAKIAYSIMSIPGIKAVEIGEGFKSAGMKGTDFHDKIYYDDKKGFTRKTNNAGGIEGGMTNGEPIIIGAKMKPIPTTVKGIETVNIKSKKKEISLKERSDVCAVPSASIVGEAMLSIEILNGILEKFGKDNIDEIINNYNSYKEYINKI